MKLSFHTRIDYLPHDKAHLVGVVQLEEEPPQETIVLSGPRADIEQYVLGHIDLAELQRRWRIIR